MCIDDEHDGDVASSSSDVAVGEKSLLMDDFGDVRDITDSREVGASKRKLQSSPFLSQFAHDGCFTSHYHFISMVSGSSGARKSESFLPQGPG